MNEKELILSADSVIIQALNLRMTGIRESKAASLPLSVRTAMRRHQSLHQSAMTYMKRQKATFLEGSPPSLGLWCIIFQKIV